MPLALLVLQSGVCMWFSHFADCLVACQWCFSLLLWSKFSYLHSPPTRLHPFSTFQREGLCNPAGSVENALTGGRECTEVHTEVSERSRTSCTDICGCSANTPSLIFLPDRTIFVQVCVQPSASWETNPTSSSRDEPGCFQSNPKPPAMTGSSNLSQRKKRRGWGENFLCSTIFTMHLLCSKHCCRCNGCTKLRNFFFLKNHCHCEEGYTTNKINHYIYIHIYMYIYNTQLYTIYTGLPRWLQW